MKKIQKYLPLRDPYNQVFNSLLVAVDSSQLQPFMSSWNVAYRVHIGQLSMKNYLYCIYFQKGPVIFHTSPIYQKESVKCAGSLNLFCNGHCKTGHTFFYELYFQSSLYPPVYTKSIWWSSTNDHMFNKES